MEQKKLDRINELAKKKKEGTLTEEEAAEPHVEQLNENTWAIIGNAELYEIEQEKQDAQVTGMRRSQVGTGMRNERIRTYNFPQGRVTDHRIGLTLYKIDQIMDGNLEEVIDALATADQAEKLKNAQQER